MVPYGILQYHQGILRGSVLKHYLGQGIVICSDESEEKWEPARRLCENHIGYGGKFRLDEV